MSSRRGRRRTGMTITTTPAVGTTARLAPRVAARTVDFAVLALIGMGIGGATGFGYGWLAAELVLVVAYFVGLDTLRGATVGKSLVGLRVTGVDGDCPPTVAEAAKREAFVVVGAIPF